MKTFIILLSMMVILTSANTSDDGLVVLTVNVTSDPNSEQNIPCFTRCKTMVPLPSQLPAYITHTMEYIAEETHSSWAFDTPTFDVEFSQTLNGSTQRFEAHLITCNSHDGTFVCDIGAYMNDIYLMYAVPDILCTDVYVNGNPKYYEVPRAMKQIYVLNDSMPENFVLHCESGTDNLKLFVMRLSCPASFYAINC